MISLGDDLILVDENREIILPVKVGVYCQFCGDFSMRDGFRVKRNSKFIFCNKRLCKNALSRTIRQTKGLRRLSSVL